MTAGRKQSQNAQYTLAGSNLELVDEHTYLGIVLQSNLTFSTHINNIACKASRLTGMLRIVLKDADTKTRLIVFINTLVRPVLEYGCPVWDLFLKKYIKILQKSTGYWGLLAIIVISAELSHP